jgi:hypothetical protein
LDFLAREFRIARQRIAKTLAVLPQEFCDLLVGEGREFRRGLPS